MRTKKIGGPTYFAIGITVVIWIVVLVSARDQWYWCLFPTVVTIIGVIITKSQKIPSDAHPNAHHPLLRDNAPYNCIHGIAPHATTGYCAWPIGHLENTPEPSDEYRRIKVYKQSDR